MHDAGDMELLRDYDRQGSEAAFAALVQRHVSLVYSVALRHVGIDAHAEEITQAVFIILARKAASLRPDTILEGWLYETTRLTALSFRRGERRRQFREQEAYMQSTLQETADASTWNRLAPLLEEAMTRLGKKDRDAVVLRFFKDKNLREVAAALKLTEPAAQKRVQRGVEKLRKFFARRGIIFPAAVLTAAISANSVQAAPLSLAKTVTAVAIAKGATASGSTLILVKGALKIIAWAKAKAAIVVGAVVLLAAGTATVAVVEIEKPPAPVVIAQTKNPSDYPWQAEGYFTNANGGQGVNGDFLLSAKAPPLVEILPTIAPNGGPGVVTTESPDEVMRLQYGSTFQQIIMSAYGFAFADDRTIIATPLPTGRYDCIDNLSHGATQAFKDAIHEKFGIIGKVVAMETNVLLLQVENSNAPGLRPSQPDSKNQDMESTGPNYREKHTAGKSFTDWVNFCESTLQTPIVDQTGLTGKYDTDLKWKWNNGESEKNAFKQAVFDQLGLALVPSREKIDILVIEKATKPFTAPNIITNPPPIMPRQVYHPKTSWAFAGYATPEAALETYFWALNKQDAKSYEASMTTSALQDAGETIEQSISEAAPELKKISGYRISGIPMIAADEIVFQVSMDGGKNDSDGSDEITIKKIGTEWKVDESP
jgi:uncharacterized protein (TIGR03435 family)